MPSDAKVRDRLYQGEFLTPEQSLTSSDGRFTLTLLSDGNLVLRDPYSRELWDSGTAGHPNVSSLTLEPTTGALIFRETRDNKLYEYSSNKIKATRGPVPHATLLLKTDGNIVLLSDDQQQCWESGTAVPETPKRPENTAVIRPGEGLSVGDSLTSANGNFRLVLQRDGNLVVESQTPVWASKSNDADIWCFILHDNGILACYKVRSRKPYWQDGKVTSSNKLELKLHDNGKLALYSDGGTQPIWTAIRRL